MPCDKCGGFQFVVAKTTREKIEELRFPGIGLKDLVDKLREILLELDAKPQIIFQTAAPAAIPAAGPLVPIYPTPWTPSPTVPTYPWNEPFPRVICGGNTSGGPKTLAINHNGESDATGFVDAPLSRQESVARMTETTEQAFAANEGLNGRMPTRL